MPNFNSDPVLSSLSYSSSVPDMTQTFGGDLGMIDDLIEEITKSPADLPQYEIYGSTPEHNNIILLSTLPPALDTNALEDIRSPDMMLSLPSTSVQSISTMDTPESRKRRRTVNQGLWKRNKAKKLFNSGEEYLNPKTGVLIPKKTMGAPCKNSCRFKCASKISESERQVSFDSFWMIGNHERQWDYILRFVKSVQKKTQKLPASSKRSKALIYNLSCNNEIIKVCKTMFLQTLSISNMWVVSAFKKNEESELLLDNRGRHNNRPHALNKATKNSVIEHINMFPKKESHYVRKNSQKEYLDENLNMVKMFRLYSIWFGSKDYQFPIATERQYKDIFSTCFNLSFFRPKKDLCEKCFIYSSSDQERKQQLESDYQQHLLFKERSREMKQGDINRAKENPITTVTACFDLQKVLTVPQSEVGVFHYKRKYAIYNLTVYDIASKDGYCYLWHLQTAKRGAIEISSCVLKFIEKYNGIGVNDFYFYSDNCAGQNKNRIILAMYLYCAEKYSVSITHRYFEKGHTQNEGDSMHSVIERAKKNKTIYVPDQIYFLAENAKTAGKPYNVKIMEQDDFYDFKSISEGRNWSFDQDKNNVCWNKIKDIHVPAGSCGILKLRYDYDSTYQTINTKSIRKTKRRPVNTFQNETLKKAYTKLIPISKPLHKDLMSLCTAGAIPNNYQYFYKSLTVDCVGSEENSQEGE
jgi:hypothetical protein